MQNTVQDGGIAAGEKEKRGKIERENCIKTGSIIIFGL